MRIFADEQSDAVRFDFGRVTAEPCFLLAGGSRAGAGRHRLFLDEGQDKRETRDKEKIAVFRREKRIDEYFTKLRIFYPQSLVFYGF